MRVHRGQRMLCMCVQRSEDAVHVEVKRCCVCMYVYRGQRMLCVYIKARGHLGDIDSLLPP